MLTPKGVEHVKPRSARYELPDGGGLYLVVQPSGAKSWAIRYRRHGRSEKLTVKGSYPAVTLAAARAEARKIQDALAHGDDPKARGSDTVSALALLYDRHHITGLRPGTRFINADSWQPSSKHGVPARSPRSPAKMLSSSSTLPL